MTEPRRPREPRVFEPDDPSLVGAPEPAGEAAPGADEHWREAAAIAAPAASASGGVRWGAILGSAVLGLALLASSVWLTQLATQALARNDVIGWIAVALVAVGGLAASAIVLRETAGLMRLRRLGRLRRDLDEALDARDAAREKALLRQLLGTFSGRGDVRWSIARFREHEGDVRDPGDLARLADREVFAPLDQRAKRIVLTSAKRVSVVTAISPMPLVDVVFVLVENLRMLRALATLYGGRPGLMAALKLGRMVVTHLVATGGIALTDDLVGQVLGQDLLRRLSRRLGEGAFNGAMTARIGTAAIQVIRPLPFLEASPVRVRDFIGELFRSAPAGLRGPR
ncbi:MAG: TIGR01620 family protein [Hyphomicrobiaceae bacterium]|nr:TIGR01620 family protein [Hyphomicrobiaceae bacterium]